MVELSMLWTGGLAKGIAIFGSVIVVGVIVFFIYMLKKGGKKFPFVLYSLDGKTSRVIYGRVKTDPANKEKKAFVFKENSSELLIAPPTLYIDRKGHREITYTPDGGLAYIKNKKIDDKLYLEKALMPEEKQITLFRMKENNTRYQNPMNKYQALIMGASLILILLLLIGIIYVTIQFGKNSTLYVTLAKENKETASSNAATTSALKSVAEQLVSVTAALTGNREIIRQIT